MERGLEVRRIEVEGDLLTKLSIKISLGDSFLLASLKYTVSLTAL